ncbi:MAG: hypothetical protein WC742_13470 [Gallionellaceae bacterium]|jgi:hypothetical protein
MALTATLFNGVCYATTADAVDAYFTSIPSFFYTNSLTNVAYFTKTSGVWYLSKFYQSTGGLWTPVGTPLAVAFTPTFPECDATAPYIDGMAIGWGVATAMFVALAIVFIKQAFFK